MKKSLDVRFVFLIAGWFFALYGCAGQTRRPPPELAQRITRIKAYGIVPPKVEVFAVDADGSAELRKDWTLEAKANIAKAVTAAFREKGVEARPLGIEVDRTGSAPPPAEIGALILIAGYDQIPSTGRSALKTSELLALGPNPLTAETLKTSLRVEIVDAAGNILWQAEKEHPKVGYDLGKGRDWLKVMKDSLFMTSLWKVHGDSAYDLRDPEKSSRFVQDLLAGFLKSLE